MPITRTARNAIASLLIGETTVKAFCSTGAVMWVGNSTEAHSATSTFLTQPISGGTIAACSLGGSTMDSGYPTRSCGLLTFRATYSTCAASGQWGEWGIYNATATGTDGVLLNRYPDNLGTKSTSASWQLTGSIEITT